MRSGLDRLMKPSKRQSLEGFGFVSTILEPTPTLARRFYVSTFQVIVLETDSPQTAPLLPFAKPIPMAAAGGSGNHFRIVRNMSPPLVQVLPLNDVARKMLIVRETSIGPPDSLTKLSYKTVLQEYMVIRIC